ncbi:hypothetical protein LI82_06560 [Methanococcoides methylutens]|uniref:Uncharacterized protein n=2 Tax=Methanococcoides methylutens TaxID=2226 RepID=A0A099T055_METMT|nr:hypothetical protein LI82_06560 [Methanococcoides methylutens]
MAHGNTDVKPGSDPNPINMKERGVLTIAVAGFDGVNGTDLSTIDLDTLQVQFNANGQKNVTNVTYRFDDVINASPLADLGTPTPVTTGDGYMDLVVKVKVQDLVSAGLATFVHQMNVGWQVNGSDPVEWEESTWDEIRVMNPGKGPK